MPLAGEENVPGVNNVQLQKKVHKKTAKTNQRAGNHKKGKQRCCKKNQEP
uniref:Uncharacterized protein n=2 Tax=Oryza TaxID=4527 RepID=A0A0E0GN43_ORYNI